jgi:transposase-like protein
MSTLSSRSTSTRAIVGANQDRCLYCRGTRLVRKGKRRKKLETVQLWYCKDCDQVFTPNALKGKTYPIPVILDGLSYYALGHSLEDAATLLQEHYGARVTPTTLSNWLKEYRPLCPYARLRISVKARYSPYRVIESTRLHHRQVYHYRIHRPKLDLLAGPRTADPATLQHWGPRGAPER